MFGKSRCRLLWYAYAHTVCILFSALGPCVMIHSYVPVVLAKAATCKPSLHTMTQSTLELLDLF